MIICICRNINESSIDNDIKNGYNTKGIVKKYGCTECKKCIPYIKKIVDKYTKQC